MSSSSRDAAIDQVLATARAALPHRPKPADLDEVLAQGALVVDLRPEADRRAEGALPGAVVIDRNVLEWRLDPTSPHRIEAATSTDLPVVLVCNDGYASSLAAVSLQQLGLHRATDLDGGYRAWHRLAQAESDPVDQVVTGRSTADRLILVVVEVSDVDRSARLYRDGFGQDVRVGNHEGEEHGSADRWISGRHAAFSWTDGAFLHFALYQAKADGPSAGAQIGFAVDDLDAAHARAVAAGAEVVHGPRPEPWGRTARYRDFDANVVSLTESGEGMRGTRPR